jgi:hypothetical protein
MMGFFMQYCKKFSLFFALFFWLSVALGASSEIHISHAELVSSDETYALYAEMDIYLDQVIETAINKSVPITFQITFDLVKKRKYWFNEDTVSLNKELVLSYHALTRQYLVKQDGQQKSYSSLSEAIQAIAQVSGWKVFARKELEKGEVYQATLQMRLDKKKLPKAIQVDAISAADWNIESSPFEWSFKEDK